MKPMAIDIIGTINELIKRALKEILLLLGILVFGLSAPLLFTVGAEWLAWRYPQYASTWAVVYMFAGPFACAIWMVFICHWDSVRQWQRMGRIKTWRQDHGGYVRTIGKSLWFMISGFFGSAVAEGVLTYTAHRMSVIPGHLMLFFAVAPLAVFAPCLIVLLSRALRRPNRQTVSRSFGAIRW